AAFVFYLSSVLRCRIQVKYIVITRRGVNFLIVFQIDGGNDDGMM
ncbi:MAG: hypothetical protein ACI8RD_014911, partial [Bacillariaceae sp.]